MPDETQDSVDFAGSGSPGKDVKINGSPLAAREAERKDSTSESPVETRDGDGDGKPKKRRKVNHACIYCRRSHMTCDQNRPCSRCIKRDIGHLCHDEPREPKKNKYEADDAQQEADGSPRQKPTAADFSPPAASLVPGEGSLDLSAPSMSQPRPSDPSSTAQAPAASGNQPQNINNNNPLFFGYNDFGVGAQNAFQDASTYHPSYMFNTAEVSDEYNLLNNFLQSATLLDDGSYYQGDEMPNFFSDPSLSNTMGPLSTPNPPIGLWNQPSQPLPQTQPTEQNGVTQPGVRPPHDRREEKYYLTAADPADTGAPEERIDRLLRAKYDAGLLKPFNYVKGYARLKEYMDKNYRMDSKQRILQQLDRFRPKFRERMQKLEDFELVLVEMWFERKLMDYDRVFASMAIPACCWRRTGEIYRGNREMAELIGVPTEQLRDGKMAIHDIIVEDTLVAYWEKFGAIAFDSNQKAILTTCSVKNLESNARVSELRCCFSFTINRDNYSIPSLIIGNFLPIVAPKR